MCGPGRIMRLRWRRYFIDEGKGMSKGILFLWGNRKWSIVTKYVIVKEYNQEMKNKHISENYTD